MTAVDPGLVEAFRAQLAARPHGARRVGWKVGAGARESVGGQLVVGNLTAATLLDDGSCHESGGRDLHADAEVAVEIGDPEVVRSYGVALEIVDLSGEEHGVAAVVGNVFHRAVAFGAMQRSLPSGLVASVRVNGQVRAEAAVTDGIRERVEAVSRVLSAVGERLEPGDRIITGAVVQVPVAPDDDVVADMGAFGRVRVSLV